MSDDFAGLRHRDEPTILQNTLRSRNHVQYVSDKLEKYLAVDVRTPDLSKLLFNLEIVHILYGYWFLASFLFKMESDAEALSNTLTDADIHIA